MAAVVKSPLNALPPSISQLPYLGGDETAQQDLGELSPDALAALAEALAQGESPAFTSEVARGPVILDQSVQRRIRFDSSSMLSRAERAAKQDDLRRAHQMALGAAWLSRLAFFPSDAEVAEGVALRFGNEAWQRVLDRPLVVPFAENAAAYAELMARPAVAWTMARGLRIMTEGRAPYLVFDIDGTIINGRVRVARLAKEALSKSAGADIYGASVLAERLRIGSVPGSALQPGDVDFSRGTWDTSHVLRQLGMTETDFPDLVGLSRKIFFEHFYDFTTVRPVDSVWPVMALASAARARGFKIIVASSRGLEDDRDKDGSSRTQQMLKSIGFWKDGDVLILKEGKSIRLSPEFSASDPRQNPGKAGRVMRFVSDGRIYPQDVVAVFENDPEQLRGFADTFGRGMATVLVLGEIPQGARPPHGGAIPFSSRLHRSAPDLLPSLSGVSSL